jgi:hypothetical protein
MRTWCMESCCSYYIRCYGNGRNSVVGIATYYGLDGPRIKILVGKRDFPHPSRTSLVPIQPPVQWAPRTFPGDKAAGAKH